MQLCESYCRIVAFASHALEFVRLPHTWEFVQHRQEYVSTQSMIRPEKIFIKDEVEVTDNKFIARLSTLFGCPAI